MKEISTPETVLAFYISNRPVSPRATIEMWRPTLELMIKDRLPHIVAHAWMEANRERLNLPIPALTTVRDWMSHLRKTATKLKATELTVLKAPVTTRGSESANVPVPSNEEKVIALAGSKEDVSSASRSQHPDLNQLPIAIFPESEASESDFEEALMPQFLQRFEQMEHLLQHYQSISAATRTDLAQAAFANLDPEDKQVYISRYADIYVIMRTVSVTVGTWADAIFRGRQAFAAAKAGRA